MRLLIMSWWNFEGSINTYDIVDLCLVRESSFNMTRGVDEDIDGGLWKILDTWKGTSEKIKGDSENWYTSKPTAGGRAPKKLNC